MLNIIFTAASCTPPRTPLYTCQDAAERISDVPLTVNLSDGDELGERSEDVAATSLPCTRLLTARYLQSLHATKKPRWWVTSDNFGV